MEIIKKLFEILSPSERRRSYLLICLIFVMAVFDMLGVASILPFIAVLSNPELVETNSVLNYIYLFSSQFGVKNINHFLFLLGVIAFFLLVFSLIIKGITQYAQVRFTLIREYRIGKSLVEAYLRQPYAWFLNRNSSDLGKNILSEVSSVMGGVMMPVITVLTQGTVVIFLLILLILTDPRLAFSVGLVFFVSYGIIYYFMKSVLFRIGTQRLKVNTDRFTTVSEAFGAVKEIKVGGLEQTFINKFSKPALIFANNQSLAAVISQLPRFFIEAIAFGGLILLVLIFMSKGNDFNSIIPIIALYAFAGYRLLPSLQQIYAAVAQIRFSEPALHSLYNELKNLRNFNDPSVQNNNLKFEKFINLKNINFYYPNTKTKALKNINLKIPALKKVGVVGLTGSGKTTIIDLILGLLEPSEGSLYVDDKLISKTNKRAWQKIIGYVPQNIYLSDTSIRENIAFGINIDQIDQKAVEKAAKISNLHQFVVNELPDSYNTIVGERGIRLSGGQRQRIGIARALYHEPKVLILDEATSALDNLTEKAVMEAMNNLENKITIILIAHRLSTVKKCDNIFLLDKGELKAQGKFEELLLINEKFKDMTTV